MDSVPEGRPIMPAGSAPDPASFCERYRSHFERWAHGRIPPWARPLLDPRVVVRQTFHDLALDASHAHAGAAGPVEGALLEQVRRALYDKVLTNVKRVALEIARESATIAFTLPLRDAGLEHDLLQRYEAGLARLSDDDRRAVLARTELALPWSNLSTVLHRDDEDSTRFMVSRALVRLAREMAHERP